MAADPEGFQFFADFAEGFLALSRMESLAYPFRYGHVAGACDSLDFAVFGVWEEDLEALSHMMSLNDS